MTEFKNYDKIGYKPGEKGNIYILNNTKRCSICDATNNLYVSNHGAYFRSNKRSFIRDPQDPTGNSVICMPCNESIVDASREYFIDVEEDHDA